MKHSSVAGTPCCRVVAESGAERCVRIGPLFQGLLMWSWGQIQALERARRSHVSDLRRRPFAAPRRRPQALVQVSRARRRRVGRPGGPPALGSVAFLAFAGSGSVGLYSDPRGGGACRVAACRAVPCDLVVRAIWLQGPRAEAADALLADLRGLSGDAGPGVLVQAWSGDTCWGAVLVAVPSGVVPLMIESLRRITRSTCRRRSSRRDRGARRGRPCGRVLVSLVGACAPYA